MVGFIIVLINFARFSFKIQLKILNQKKNRATIHSIARQPVQEPLKNGMDEKCMRCSQ